MTDTNGAGLSTTDSTTSVLATAVADAPVITGTAAGQNTTDVASVTPFANVAITERDVGQTETVTVTPNRTAYGVLSDPNATNDGSSVVNGVYTVTGDASAVTVALDDLIFAPTGNQAPAGQAAGTAFTVADTNTAGAMATDSATTVIVKPTNGLTFAPIIYNGLSFTNIGVTETNIGTVAPFTASPGQLQGVTTSSGAALGWGSFDAGAYYAGSSEVVNFAYTVSVTSSSSLIDTVGQLYEAVLFGPGVSLVAVEDVYDTTGHVIGTETFTGGVANSASMVLTEAEATVDVNITLTLAVDSSGTDSSFVYSGLANQSFGTIAAPATIDNGSGPNTITLGDGSYTVISEGNDTITGGTGTETVNASAAQSDLVYGGASQLVFIGGAGAATVLGGTGSDTVTGGSGPDLFQGGSTGNNVLTAGTGAATLFGGGDGDQLFGSGSGTQIFYAATGNETLSGSTVSGSNNTFVAGPGAATVIANPSATNLFEFIDGSAGGTEMVMGLSAIGQVNLHLSGYTSNDTGSVASQNNAGGNLNVTLSDGTQITFQNIASPLTNSNFV
jgi:hypothetical protein